MNNYNKIKFVTLLTAFLIIIVASISTANINDGRLMAGLLIATYLTIYIATLWKFLDIKGEPLLFYIFIGAFIIWICYLWGFNILGELSLKEKVLTTIASITATLAPLGFYITYKNYQRKSGIELKSLVCFAYSDHAYGYDTYIKSVIIENMKDKALGIKSLQLIINNKYILNITPSSFPSSVKAYDILKCDRLPTSWYRDEKQRLIELKEILKLKCKCQLIITTIDGTKFLSDERSIESLKEIYFDNFTKNDAPVKNYKNIAAYSYPCRVPLPVEVIRPLNIDCSIFIIDKQYREYFFIVGIQVNANREIIALHPFYKGFNERVRSENYFDENEISNLLDEKIENISDLNRLHESIKRLLLRSNFYKDNPSTYDLISYHPSQPTSRLGIIKMEENNLENG